MKSKLLIFVLLFSITNLFAQIEDAWVYFKDKPDEASYYDAPLSMLSQRALDRRTRYNISLDFKDIPIEPAYITAVKNSSGISVLAKSKWLNAIHIQGTQANVDALLNLELSGNFFIDSIEYANKTLNSSKPGNELNRVKSKNKQLETTTDFTYGSAENQIVMLGGNALHQNNFTGEGMQIAILDAGFPNVDTFLAFKRIRDNGQILGGYDFVDRSTIFYSGNSHGTSVLSAIAGYLESGVSGATTNFVGTAPGASFYLFRTENASVEVKLEESLWVEAAEKADSLGVDVINTSLGYSVFFDNPDHNYEYSDMDGKTAFITRGAEIAFSRGMILVNSAGNEGNDSVWPYINAPADGPSVLTVGAVNTAGTIASFSSYGPTFDGRIKPDVCAQGQGTSLINSAGNVGSGNGTSFSSPVLTGVVACLWQAFPNKTNNEIIQMVRESAHLFSNPNNHEGYGIPNFKTIFDSPDDLDGDGVVDTIDLCVNTPIGAEVDAQGCLLLPSDNFIIEVISESCLDKNNGQLIITSGTTYNYQITVNSVEYSLSNNTFSLLDLEPGVYELCMSLESQNLNQCYNFEIKEGIEVSGKVKNVSNKSAIFEIIEGTSPYTVYINGIEKMQTENPVFEVPINQGDLIEVKTSVTCEGTFSKEILLEELISIYPNPISSFVKFNFPYGINKLDITVFNVLGDKVLATQVNKNIPFSDISFLSEGMYFMKVEFDNQIKIFKVLKN